MNPRDMNNPSDTFYWKDWENDQGLRISSLAAQGLWMRLLCIAAKSDLRGFVKVNGHPLDTMAIARVASIPTDEAEILLSELERNGVFSRDRQGCIYSRKMVKSDQASKKARENGAKGGNPALTSSDCNYYEKNKSVNLKATGKVKVGVKGPLKPPLPIPLEDNEDKSSSSSGDDEDFSDDDYEAILLAVGYDPDGHIPKAWAKSSLVIASWLERLTPSQIADAVRASKHLRPEMPATPQALDGVMDRALASPAKESPRATEADILANLAKAVNGAGFLPPSFLSPSRARALIEAGLVTPEKLKERGIAA